VSGDVTTRDSDAIALALVDRSRRIPTKFVGIILIERMLVVKPLAGADTFT